MDFRRIWTLNGPNYWANFPVLEVLVDLGDLRDRSSELIPGFNDRLRSWLPTLVEHRCSVGERGGFFQRLERGTYMAHILEHVTLELQALAGSSCGYGRARELEEDGVYRVAIQFEEEPLARACLETGRQLILAAVHDAPFDVAAEIVRLKEMAYDVRLGPSTFAIVKAAKARGIPFRRLNRHSLVQLGIGAKARRICTAETDRTSAIAEAVAQDKELTRLLLKSAGVPVPDGRTVASADEAWEAAQALGLPVVVKPQFGNHGRGVQTDLRTREQVAKAYETARAESEYLMVEQFIEGIDHRVLVVGDRMIAAAIRHPAHVIGDGTSTITQLVAEVNRDPRRSDGHSTVLSLIKLDPIGLEVLVEQGFTPDSVLPQGRVALIRRNGNLSTGGTSTDVTDRVHPEVAARAVEAAKIVGLDIAGVDIVAVDIRRSLEEQRGAIVEVNAGPGLRMHIEPTEGEPRPVGDAIVEMLFPRGETGRIPLVAISGTRGRNTTSRLVAHLLRATNRIVGLVTTHRVMVGDRCSDLPGQSESAAARCLLLNPIVEAAVFAVGAETIGREGLGFDRCDVAIVTDLGPVETLPMFGLETLENRVRLDRSVVDVVLPQGAAVLNADDPLVVEMAPACKGSVIFVSRDPQSPLLAAHRERAGRCVFVRDGAIVLASGVDESRLLTLLEVPLIHTSSEVVQITNVLAGIAAAWSLGVPLEALRLALNLFPAQDVETA
jgi:cyanophycin synthetase